MCRDITKNVINGINGSIFTYGQTTSGKTFTMLGNPQKPGILPCVLKDLFDLIQKETCNMSVYCSYIEIYNENIHDLLSNTNSLKLIDDPKYGVIVSVAKLVHIKNFEGEEDDCELDPLKEDLIQLIKDNPQDVRDYLGSIQERMDQRAAEEENNLNEDNALKIVDSEEKETENVKEESEDEK